MTAMATGSGESRAKTTLLLVRHGQSMGNKLGRFGGHTATPLTDLGQRQAQATADAIVRAHEPTAIVSSDLARAVSTAQPIAAASDLSIEQHAGLRERSVGILDGKSFEETKVDHPELWAQLLERSSDFCPPEGESIDAVIERVGTALAHVVDAHAGGCVVVVSHAIALHHTLCHIAGAVHASPMRLRFRLDNCSVSTVARDQHGWTIRALNNTAHLADVMSHM